MQQANVYAQYKEQSLSTLTNGEIIIKLFEEASKQITMSMFLISKEDFVAAFNCIQKSRKIISALQNNLDMQYPVAHELFNIYQFVFEKLGEASVSRDIALLKDLLSIVDDFKVTFRQADKLAKINK